MNKIDLDKYEDIIHSFDKQIDKYVKDLEGKIEDINFDTLESIEFTLDDNINVDSLFNTNVKKGVYLFELDMDSLYPNITQRKTKIKHFAKDWKKKKNDSFFSSSIIKSRQKLYEDFDEKWLPLYIGKCKNLNKRIKEHIELSPKKHTYAMKLKHRPSLLGARLRVSTIELNVKNYDFIVPHIERTLRDKYNPIVGKQ
ncbi:hypothetical protein HX089_16870 [Myroides odoratimimus]|uniref:hypothetical protein n=1 Tax=Myroides odoratimimus TaxID=76832 RepID=UPI00257761A9|nr:hypothetical protein [Myroides odoratimimus]MDM1518027.1 hypothetical protein [Myroides odoratimimus]